VWKGQLTSEIAMLFSVVFLATSLRGGWPGVLPASPPLDFHVTDSYFVVADFHYALFGTIVFATFAGVYFWFTSPRTTTLADSVRPQSKPSSGKSRLHFGWRTRPFA
jgi:heme/copper-type cytochrome/quinol oxidase subunit 1